MASVQCNKPTEQNINHVQSSTVSNKTSTPNSQKAVCNKTNTPTSQKTVCNNTCTHTSQKAVTNKTSTPTIQKANNENHSFADKMRGMANKMFHHEHHTQQGQKAHIQQGRQSVCHASCATHANHTQHSTTHTTTNGKKKMEVRCMPMMRDQMKIMRKKNKEEKYKFSDSSSSSDDSDNEKSGRKKN